MDDPDFQAAPAPEASLQADPPAAESGMPEPTLPELPQVPTSGITKLTAAAGATFMGAAALSGFTRMHAREPVYKASQAVGAAKDAIRHAHDTRQGKDVMRSLKSALAATKEEVAQKAGVWKFGESWEHLGGAKPKVIAFSLVAGVATGAAIWAAGHYMGRCFVQREAARRQEQEKPSTQGQGIG